MNKSFLITGGLIVIILGIGVFFAVQSGQQNKNVGAVQERPQLNITGIPTNIPSQPNNSERRPPFLSGVQAPGVPNGSQPFFGTVSNLDTSSFTVQGPRDTLKILVTSSTEFKDGTSSDLKDDIQVVGYGTKNDDNSITALQIQLNVSMPAGRGQFPSR